MSLISKQTLAKEHNDEHMQRTQTNTTTTNTCNEHMQRPIVNEHNDEHMQRTPDVAGNEAMQRKTRVVSKQDILKCSCAFIVSAH